MECKICPKVIWDLGHCYSGLLVVIPKLVLLSRYIFASIMPVSAFVSHALHH